MSTAKEHGDKRDATVAALLRGMASALEGDIAGGRKVDPAGMLLVIRKIQSFTPSHALENAEPGCPHGMQTGGIPKAPCALCEADRLAASVPSTTPQKAGELLTREHDKSLRGAAARLALATGFQFDDCALDIQQVCNHVLAEHYAPSTTPRKLPFSLPAYVGDEYQGMHTVFAADHAIVAECYHSGIAEMIVKFFNGASAASATPRSAVIEECAKVCDQVYDETQKIASAVVKPATRKKELRHQAIGATCCAARLRALMNSPDGGKQT